MEFYDILCSGMSTEETAFPIIAYRNYLLESRGYVPTTYKEIGRCQYALKKYLEGKKTKRSIAPKDLIWPMPYQKQRGETK
ncbi:MAG: hypothetical protein IJL91_06845 [Bacteroidales bacterium]|nr:hypothetical protein [Bacteroidales bacterium]